METFVLPLNNRQRPWRTPGEELYVVPRRLATQLMQRVLICMPRACNPGWTDTRPPQRAYRKCLLGVCVMRSDEGRDSVPSALFRDILNRPRFVAERHVLISRPSKIL